jgi:hypothetical protein
MQSPNSCEYKHLIVPTYHPINQDNLDYWCQMMLEYDTRISAKYPEYQDVCTHIANAIQMNLRHISHQEFHEQITRVANELFTRIQELAHLGYKFVFITSDTNKSNHWVYELIMTILEPKLSCEPGINQVIYVSSGAMTNSLNDYYQTRHQDRFISTYTLSKLLKADPQPKIMFIYPDDMSYSGTQLFTGIAQIDELINDTVSGIGTNYNAVNNIHYPCLGYITNLAKQQLGQISNIEFPKETEIIQVLDELLSMNPTTNQQQINISNLDKIFDVLGLSSGLQPKHALIYFDHKVADYVSFPDKIINYGWYPGSMDCDVSNSLVSNPDKEYFRKTRMAIQPCYKM